MQQQNGHIAPLYGLVLAGGRSQRMGSDKGLLAYHGIPQREFAGRLMEPICDAVYLSLRQDQDAADSRYPGIFDTNRYRGPFNGILSAHEAFPEVAWLVVACDLPLLDVATLELLLSGRRPDSVATSLVTGVSGLPEPLAAIWEPHGLTEACTYLDNATSSCPRKFLIRAGATCVRVPDDAVLANANNPEERQVIRDRILGL